VEVVRGACRWVVRMQERERASEREIARAHKVARKTPEREIERCRGEEGQK